MPEIDWEAIDANRRQHLGLPAEAQQDDARQQFIARLRELTHRWYTQADLERMADELMPLAARPSADAETLRRVEELFSGGPDTSCQTTWRREAGWSLPGIPFVQIECVEVPLDDLRAALDGTQ